MKTRKSTIAASAFLLSACSLLGACKTTGDLDETGGITAIRTACPSVAVPASTGDITVFDPATSRDASAVDVTAVLTKVRSTCTDSGADILTSVTFSVEGRRTSTDGARDVTLPYFVTVVQGGSAVVAKRIGHATLHFEPGQARASIQGTGSATVARSAATLSDDVRKKLTEKRRPGDQEAAVDPLTRPEIRAAVLRSTFEALVGFQLTNDQLKYNATR
ncbi:hypothetical protein [Sphingomonas psychrolutea]|uniref:hypothetical protein n=1 Tax=Sphingomonas psychrolutea TaxID=1259676 RepID=UPI001E57770D|nr:hypothetical protein [Sphingomonas psychrolutea]